MRKYKYEGFVILENEKIKMLESKFYNYYFEKDTGLMAQWGETEEQDPLRAPAPVLADIEILNMCKGPGGKLCPYCYKSNTPNGHYMTFETYQKILSVLPKSLTQIAFGADADLSMNPDIWKIMIYTREQGIIPNITVADINKETAEKLAEICGAVAVSRHFHVSKDICYDSVKYLIDTGMEQVNIHFVLSKESLKYVDEIINDIKNDPRLRGLNSLVFLGLKQKGRGRNGYQICSVDEYKSVIKKCLDNNIPFGFDSCSAIKFLQAAKDLVDEETFEQFKDMTEPCESFSQSIYINEKGEAWPCSFMENEGWYNGEIKKWNLLDLNSPQEFLDKVWNSKEAIQFSFNAKVCHGCGQGCQYYNV